MRNSDESICIDLKIPYGQPDSNGTLYTKEAIKNALDKGIANLPVICIDNDRTESIIGCIKDEQAISEWDDLNGVCKIKVNGIDFFAGTSCIINEIENGVVKDFEITGTGI